MRNYFSKIALTATLGLALAFTFSCSSDDGNTNHTYYYSWYGINKNSLNSCSTIEALFPCRSSCNTDKSFKEVKDLWSEVKRLDVSFIESGTGLTESDIKNILVEADVTPKEADSHIALLKSRGNGCAAFGTSDYRYCYLVVYVEQE
ncbi:hypothetical protein R83H12_00545 [Fibrobacteria bacterium R8-3-H12]